jgi:hypothetical protein
MRLRALHAGFENRAQPSLTLGQALKIALEVEETELEDLVADLLKASKSDEYERCLRLLVHDLGELSYMIEQNAQEDPDLLQRCDALVNRHAEELRKAART